MQLYVAICGRDVLDIYVSYNQAVIRAGDYWSMLEGEQPPVVVRRVPTPLYDSIERCRNAAAWKQPWYRDATTLVWMNGRPVYPHATLCRRLST